MGTERADESAVDENSGTDEKHFQSIGLKCALAQCFKKLDEQLPAMWCLTKIDINFKTLSLIKLKRKYFSYKSKINKNMKRLFVTW